jgi:phage-related protein
MDKISWIDSNGIEFPFDTVLNGMNGRFMPPIAFTEEEMPFLHGSRLRNIKVKPRDVDIPIHLKDASEIEIRNMIRTCLRLFNPLKGDGKIRVLAPDGSQRELNCRYLQGLEGKEDKDSKGLAWMNFVLVFHAFDPFWYDSSTQVQTFKINESPGSFFPILPLRLASSTVFADITINNTGDVEAWPEWIIMGPGDGIVLSNLSTGESTGLNLSIGIGETVTINTRPLQKTITKDDGTNLFYTMTDNSSLWALQEGNNSIQIEMANATTDSSIQLTYKNRYWGP